MSYSLATNAYNFDLSTVQRLNISACEIETSSVTQEGQTPDFEPHVELLHEFFERNAEDISAYETLKIIQELMQKGVCVYSPSMHEVWKIRLTGLIEHDSAQWEFDRVA